MSLLLNYDLFFFELRCSTVHARRQFGRQGSLERLGSYTSDCMVLEKLGLLLSSGQVASCPF